MEKNIDDLWNVLKTMNFSWWDLVRYSELVEGTGASTTTLDAHILIKFKEQDDEWVIAIREMSSIRHSISFEVVQSSFPTVSAVHTISLTRIPRDEERTFVEWVSDFSNDATVEFIEDSCFKRHDIFGDLSRVSGDVVPLEQARREEFEMATSQLSDIERFLRDDSEQLGPPLDSAPAQLDIPRSFSAPYHSQLAKTWAEMTSLRVDEVHKRVQRSCERARAELEKVRGDDRLVFTHIRKCNNFEHCHTYTSKHEVFCDSCLVPLAPITKSPRCDKKKKVSK